jgi:hypothetical protein
MYLSKENHLFYKQQHLAHGFPVRIEFVLKGIIPGKQNFVGIGTFFFSKFPYSTKLMKHMYLSKDNHLCYKPQHLAHGFPVRIAFILKGILPAKQNFVGGGMFFYFQIGLLN